MNPFENQLVDFLLFKKDASLLKENLAAIYEISTLPHPDCPASIAKFTDVYELLTKSVSETQAEERDKKNKTAASRLKLFSLLLLTLPFPPVTDCSKKDTPVQRPFPDSQGITDWVKTLFALREHYEVLRTGFWEQVLAEGDLFGYTRTTRENLRGSSSCNQALILVNRSTKCELPVSLKVSNPANEFLIDALDNYRKIPLHGGRLETVLGPLKGSLLLKDRWATGRPLKRRSGILLHPTSLPSNYGIGDMGISAYEFVDFLEECGQKLWQILPLNPPGYGNSPYQCLSAFAGNPLLIDIDQLIQEGLLRHANIGEPPSFPPDRVCFEEVCAYKTSLLRKAFREFQKRTCPPFLGFCLANRGWLDDFCLFMALKNHHKGKPWHQWDHAAASRNGDALAHYQVLLEEEINYHKFVQFQFFRQWSTLKDYARKKGISIIGDLPIYVAHDSSDVWKHRELFFLDSTGNPVKVSGVPPDEFARTGQLWGNPIYRWDTMEKTGFQWWKERMKHLSRMVDLIRIDHFRGFEAYWEVPAEDDTAENGRWVKGPGRKFFLAISEVTGSTEIIAEDLGFITPEVEKLKDEFGFPGMSILQFDIQNGEYIVPLYKKNTVAYTGTHDNDTILGWHRKNCSDQSPEGTTREDICWGHIEMAMHSDAETVIIPLQDIFCLGSRARMNTPGTATGNWEWRFSSEMLDGRGIRERLFSLTKAYHR